MKRTTTAAISILALICAAGAIAFGQGSQGGRGGAPTNTESPAHVMDNAISEYLDGEALARILTPGEYVEWTLPLKAGQVVIAEARSDAFDPALEVVDQREQTLEANDDRYPGDQRPLLLWAADVEGSYSLRVRSFRGKAGGPFVARFKVYDAIDLGSGKFVETQFDRLNAFLFRLPMKAGQIQRIVVENPDPRRYTQARLGPVIAPGGFPDIKLASPLRAIIPDAIIAPVDGVYYVLGFASIRERTMLRAQAQTLVPSVLERADGHAEGKARTNAVSVWELPVKAGEIIEVSTSGLDIGSRAIVLEKPDVAEYALSQPDNNPFYPRVKPVDSGPALVTLPGRARDNRIVVVAARRDVSLWIASNGLAAGLAAANREFTLTVKRATRDYVAQNSNRGKLAIGRTDYWTFDVAAGDVVAFRAAAEGFAARLVVRDPDLAEVWNGETSPDRADVEWNLIARKPGRYLVAMSCLGDGGGGEYVLSRNVFEPKEFRKGAPASGRLVDGDVQVWKVTVRPGDPALIRWTSSNWSYTVTVRDDNGGFVGLPLTQVDRSSKYGILKVEQPTTYLIVLTGNRNDAQYTIELSDLPGLTSRN